MLQESLGMQSWSYCSVLCWFFVFRFSFFVKAGVARGFSYSASQIFFWVLSRYHKQVSESNSPDPLHGVTLEQILISLEAHYGWENLADRIPVRCFESNPSIPSSLKFLRKTAWARTKVEELYKMMLRSR